MAPSTDFYAQHDPLPGETQEMPSIIPFRRGRRSLRWLVFLLFLSVSLLPLILGELYRFQVYSTYKPGFCLITSGEVQAITTRTKTGVVYQYKPVFTVLLPAQVNSQGGRTRQGFLDGPSTRTYPDYGGANMFVLQNDNQVVGCTYTPTQALPVYLVFYGYSTAHALLDFTSRALPMLIGLLIGYAVFFLNVWLPFALRRWGVTVRGRIVEQKIVGSKNTHIAVVAYRPLHTKKAREYRIEVPDPHLKSEVVLVRYDVLNPKTAYLEQSLHDSAYGYRMAMSWIYVALICAFMIPFLIGTAISVWTLPS